MLKTKSVGKGRHHSLFCRKNEAELKDRADQHRALMPANKRMTMKSTNGECFLFFFSFLS